MNKMNLIFNIFLLAVLVYSGWHLGRYYEHRNFGEKIKEYTVEAYYFTDPQIDDPFINVTKELYIVGKVDAGLCITQEGLERLDWIE